MRRLGYIYIVQQFSIDAPWQDMAGVMISIQTPIITYIALNKDPTLH